LSNALQGSPVLLIHQGKILDKNLQEEKITIDELYSVLREHGVNSHTEVDLAVLEVNGNISVLTHSYSQKSNRVFKST